MELNKRYIVDLSELETPADIVYELSNEIEKPAAANQTVWLKLGDIALSQSQILSINSLISSINSKLALIESQSEETKASAEALGISSQAVEEQIQNELEASVPEAPLSSADEKPTEQYIPMSDHLDSEAEEILAKADDDISISVFDELKTELETEDKEQDDKEEQEKVSEKIKESENNTPLNDDKETEEKAEEVNSVEEKTVSEDNEDTETDEELSEPVNEEIQEQLDSIFDSEVKLENILSDEQESIIANSPLTKEEGEFEIPDEVLTDEDYEILQMSTQYHKQTVRSGQVIQSNGNVVIIGDCHPGCEIHAAGDITVWGVLAGIAHAGCKGNTKAKIRALTLNAIQLRIADSYARRPDHIKNIYNEKTNTFTPEEARNINGSIVILKINDN